MNKVDKEPNKDWKEQWDGEYWTSILIKEGTPIRVKTNNPSPNWLLNRKEKELDNYIKNTK